MIHQKDWRVQTREGVGENKIVVTSLVHFTIIYLLYISISYKYEQKSENQTPSVPLEQKQYQ